LRSRVRPGGRAAERTARARSAFGPQVANAMRTGPLRLRLLLALGIAFVLQVAYGSSWTIRAARPDLALVTTLVCCLFVGARTSAAFGFALGLLEASWSNLFVGSIIVSRTIVCWAVGLLEEIIFRDSVLVAVAVVLGGT